MPATTAERRSVSATAVGVSREETTAAWKMRAGFLWRGGLVLALGDRYVGPNKLLAMDSQGN